MSEAIAFIAGLFVAATVCCSWLVNDTPMYPSSMQYSHGFEDGYKKAMEDYEQNGERNDLTVWNSRRLEIIIIVEGREE